MSQTDELFHKYHHQNVVNSSALSGNAEGVTHEISLCSISFPYQSNHQPSQTLTDQGLYQTRDCYNQTDCAQPHHFFAKPQNDNVLVLFNL